jgi:hypothetical protein
MAEAETASRHFDPAQHACPQGFFGDVKTLRERCGWMQHTAGAKRFNMALVEALAILYVGPCLPQRKHAASRREDARCDDARAGPCGHCASCNPCACGRMPATDKTAEVQWCLEPMEPLEGLLGDVATGYSVVKLLREHLEDTSWDGHALSRKGRTEGAIEVSRTLLGMARRGVFGPLRRGRGGRDWAALSDHRYTALSGTAPNVGWFTANAAAASTAASVRLPLWLSGVEALEEEPEPPPPQMTATQQQERDQAIKPAKLSVLLGLRARSMFSVERGHMSEAAKELNFHGRLKAARSGSVNGFLAAVEAQQAEFLVVGGSQVEADKAAENVRQSRSGATHNRVQAPPQGGRAQGQGQQRRRPRRRLLHAGRGEGGRGGAGGAGDARGAGLSIEALGAAGALLVGGEMQSEALTLLRHAGGVGPVDQQRQQMYRATAMFGGGVLSRVQQVSLTTQAGPAPASAAAVAVASAAAPTAASGVALAAAPTPTPVAPPEDDTPSTLHVAAAAAAVPSSAPATVPSLPAAADEADGQLDRPVAAAAASQATLEETTPELPAPDSTISEGQLAAPQGRGAIRAAMKRKIATAYNSPSTGHLKYSRAVTSVAVGAIMGGQLENKRSAQADPHDQSWLSDDSDEAANDGDS